MAQACWSANPRGEYWIDISLGGISLEMLVDSGLIDAKGQVGFSIDASLYDQIKQAGGFQNHQTHARLMANGQIAFTESGLIDAQLICPTTKQLIGPIVHLYAYRGAAGVPDRVGVPFFHNLTGCKVVWDLGQRAWCIEYS